MTLRLYDASWNFLRVIEAVPDSWCPTIVVWRARTFYRWPPRFEWQDDFDYIEAHNYGHLSPGGVLHFISHDEWWPGFRA